MHLLALTHSVELLADYTGDPSAEALLDTEHAHGILLSALVYYVGIDGARRFLDAERCGGGMMSLASSLGDLRPGSPSGYLALIAQMLLDDVNQKIFLSGDGMRQSLLPYMWMARAGSNPCYGWQSAEPETGRLAGLDDLRRMVEDHPQARVQGLLEATIELVGIGADVDLDLVRSAVQG